MNHAIRITIFAAAVTLSSCATFETGGQRPSLSAADYERHLVTLSSDAFEGRKPGTAGERKTLEYLTDEFRKLGLKPGNGDSYLQAVPFVEITAGSDAQLRLGDAELKNLEDMVIWTKRVVPEVSLQDSPLVFVGHGVVAPEYGWNDYAGVDMRGKTAVILINDPGFATGDPQLFRGKAMTYYGRWTYKFEEATRQGAAGAILIHDDAPAAYPWDTVQNSWSGPQLDMVTPDGNATRPAIEGWITRRAGEALLRASGHEYSELLRAASRPGFRPLPLAGTASGSLRNAIRRGNSANFVAVLPGTRHADEYVVYMAHWDHLGRAFGRSGDTIFNGALDNASGTSGLLTIARGFAESRRRPERSIVFLAVTLEESGLLGSAYYVANPTFPLARTVAAFNMDAMSWGGPTRDVTVIGAGASELEDDLARAARRQDRVVKEEPTPENGFFFRSDHFNFAKVGVPALYIKLGIDDREKGAEWGREQLALFTRNDYHKPSDEFRPGTDLRGGLEDLALLYEIGGRLADERRFPNWRPQSEFRAARDRSLGEAGVRR